MIGTRMPGFALAFNTRVQNMAPSSEKERVEEVCT